MDRSYCEEGVWVHRKTSTWNPRGARKTGRPKQTSKKNVLVEQEDAAKHEVRLRGWWVTVSDKGVSQMPYVPNGTNGYTTTKTTTTTTTTTTTLNRLLITSDIKRLLADGTGIRLIRGWQTKVEERETNKMQLIWCLPSNFYLSTFRASLCPSSGEQDRALPHMVFCTGCTACGCVELGRKLCAL